MSQANGLRTLRLEKGWSQEQLATLSGLSERTIQRVERGDTPSLDTLGALAASFDLSTAQMRDLIESQPEPAPMSDTSPQPGPSVPEDDGPLLSMRHKRFLLGGVLYGAALIGFSLLQPRLGWDPEFLPFIAIAGGGLLASYGVNQWTDKDR